MLQLAKNALQFVRTNDFPAIVQAFNSRDAHPLLQFTKYGLCGISAVVAHNVVVYLLGTWIPFSRGSGLENTVRSNNQILANLIAFPIGNAVAYATNALWVFEGGRHSRTREFLFFTAISFVSFLVGLLGGPLLVRYYGISEHFAQGGFILTSALVNFACRKFLVFKG